MIAPGIQTSSAPEPRAACIAGAVPSHSNSPPKPKPNVSREDRVRGKVRVEGSDLFMRRDGCVSFERSLIKAVSLVKAGSTLDLTQGI